MILATPSGLKFNYISEREVNQRIVVTPDQWREGKVEYPWPKDITQSNYNIYT
jgi:hypothetical protein